MGGDRSLYANFDNRINLYISFAEKFPAGFIVGDSLQDIAALILDLDRAAIIGKGACYSFLPFHLAAILVNVPV
ncbi:hypothetical protein SDC9_149480 [bioreactor metagenome]|uniref:Uncharacterized protein n=1 Tax=bioreactor metagenome TaxID=1076179 RepID=A0A645ELC3_9ZZZZ